MYLYLFIYKWSHRYYVTNKIFCHCYFLPLFICLLHYFRNTHYTQIYLLNLCYTIIPYKIIILKGIFLKFSSIVSHFSNSVVNIYRHLKPVNRIELLSALIDEENKTI